ncbi:hypothetical protein [Tessaracoccus sp.]
MTGLEGSLLGTPEQMAAAAAIIGGLLIVGGIVAWLVKYVWPLSHRLGRFLDDWSGTPERPGFDPVPGFPQRLKSVETMTISTARATTDNTTKLEGLEKAMAEVKVNLEEVKQTASNTRESNTAKLERLELAVADVQHNVKPNTGSSAHDIVTGQLKEFSDFLAARFPDWKVPPHE